MEDYLSQLMDKTRRAMKKLTPGVLVTALKTTASVQLWVRPFSNDERHDVNLGPNLTRGTQAIVISVIECADSEYGLRPWALLLLDDGQIGWCRVLDRLSVKRAYH